MGKNLIIVESPSKAKTIEKFLGSNYVVKASMGHLRDLPSKSLGVDIENNFKAKFTNNFKKEKLSTLSSNFYLISINNSNSTRNWMLKLLIV